MKKRFNLMEKNSVNLKNKKNKVTKIFFFDNNKKNNLIRHKVNNNNYKSSNNLIKSIKTKSKAIKSHNFNI